MTVVSGNIRFIADIPGVPWRRSVKRQTGNRKRRFSGLSDVFGTLGDEASIIIQYHLVPCRLSTGPKIHYLEWPIYVKFSLLRTALS